MEIDKNEVLRYLGYKNQQISSGLDQKIDFFINSAPQLVKPKSIWEIFEPEFSAEGVALKNTTLKFGGKSIYNHLTASKKVAVMAVTLGIEAERAILKYQHTDMTEAVILDAVFDALIECVADKTENEIKKFVKKEGLYTNYRFSPGYGDFPLDTQKPLISSINAEKRIGLTVTDSNILLPRKSVTAVIGLFSEIPPELSHSCLNCNMKDKCKSKRKCKNNV